MIGTVLRLATMAALALSPLRVSAEMPAGHNAPAFAQAVEAWLADDDKTALPALAELAKGGNRAAAILLDRIEEETPLSPYARGLGQEGRDALLQPEGGGHWTDALRDEAPMARAFADRYADGPIMPAVRDLLSMGETHAAVLTMMELPDEEWSLEALEIAGDAWLDPGLRFLVLLAAPGRLDAAITSHWLTLCQDNTTADAPFPPLNDLCKAGRPPVREAATMGYLMGLHFPGYEQFRTSIGDWLVGDPRMAPYGALCRAECAGAEPVCALALWRIARATKGNFWLPYAPSEALVGQARYLSSPRAEADLRRSSASGLAALEQGNGLAPDLAEPAQCIVRVLR